MAINKDDAQNTSGNNIHLQRPQQQEEKGIKADDRNAKIIRTGSRRKGFDDSSNIMHSGTNADLGKIVKGLREELTNVIGNDSDLIYNIITIAGESIGSNYDYVAISLYDTDCGKGSYGALVLDNNTVEMSNYVSNYSSRKDSDTSMLKLWDEDTSARMKQELEQTYKLNVDLLSIGGASVDVRKLTDGLLPLSNIQLIYNALIASIDKQAGDYIDIDTVVSALKSPDSDGRNDYKDRELRVAITHKHTPTLNLDGRPRAVKFSAELFIAKKKESGYGTTSFSKNKTVMTLDMVIDYSIDDSGRETMIVPKLIVTDVTLGITALDGHSLIALMVTHFLAGKINTVILNETHFDKLIDYISKSDDIGPWMDKDMGEKENYLKDYLGDPVIMLDVDDNKPSIFDAYRYNSVNAEVQEMFSNTFDTNEKIEDVVKSNVLNITGEYYSRDGEKHDLREITLCDVIEITKDERLVDDYMYADIRLPNDDNRLARAEVYASLDSESIVTGTGIRVTITNRFLGQLDEIARHKGFSITSIEENTRGGRGRRDYYSDEDRYRSSRVGVNRNNYGNSDRSRYRRR